MAPRRPTSRLYPAEVVANGQRYHGHYRVDDRRITVIYNGESSTSPVGFSDPATIARTMLLNLVGRQRRSGGS